jgi:hypothetical protein
MQLLRKSYSLISTCYHEVAKNFILIIDEAVQDLDLSIYITLFIQDL